MAGAVAGAAPPSVTADERPRVRWTFAPVPIPRGTPALGGNYHIVASGLPPNPVDAEPSSITNFQGFVGLAYISGMVTRTNVRTGEQQAAGALLEPRSPIRA